jgi:hypothetical protein
MFICPQIIDTCLYVASPQRTSSVCSMNFHPHSLNYPLRNALQTKIRYLPHSNISDQTCLIRNSVQKVTMQLTQVTSGFVLLTIFKYCHCYVTTLPLLIDHTYIIAMWNSRVYIFWGTLNLHNTNCNYNQHATHSLHYVNLPKTNIHSP